MGRPASDVNWVKNYVLRAGGLFFADYILWPVVVRHEMQMLVQQHFIRLQQYANVFLVSERRLDFCVRL